MEINIQEFTDKLVADVLDSDELKTVVAEKIQAKIAPLVLVLLNDDNFLSEVYRKAVMANAHKWVANEIGNRLRCGIYDNGLVMKFFEESFPQKFREQIQDEIRGEIRKQVKTEVGDFIKRLLRDD